MGAITHKMNTTSEKDTIPSYVNLIAFLTQVIVLSQIEHIMCNTF